MKLIKYIFLPFPIVVVQILFVWFAVGQTKPLSSGSDELESKAVSKQGVTLFPMASVALEGTIDPDNYFIGPSDGISVNLWLSPPVSFALTVTPEGTLIIPTVGEVKVADLSLREAKAKVISEVRRKYISGDVSVTLMIPRSVVVTVTGSVKNKSTFTLSATNRVDKAVNQAVLLNDASLRNIILRRRDGKENRVDISMYYATRENKWNPYVREGDVIIIQSTSLNKNVIGVYGAVNSPGCYEFIEGDSLTDAIKLAYGFRQLAISDSVVLSRLDSTASVLSMKIINVREILEGQRANVALESGDRINVKAKVDLREDYRVSIQGEVLYPGTYPITKNHTKLFEIILHAGGFTEFASLKSAELNRRSVLPSEVEIDRLLSYRGGVSHEDSSDYYLETELRLRKEIVNVDFEKLFFQHDSTQDIILQTEDYIVVPSVRKTIYVFGQVVSPGHIPFVMGKDASYYVKKAGGYTDRARKGDMKVIKGKTKQWLETNETIIENGDYIWIPKDPDRPFSYYMTIASQAASVLSVIIGIAVVIVQVTK
jgi:polysaccharide biosynthesis/export protein